ncbi:MAG TPA: hypothetical protein VGO94_14585 [Mycobacteriales bacterium]|nr:hypothetical protein [Mycobacteriales bacterium]
MDGGEGAAVSVADPDALVIAGRHDRDRDAVLANRGDQAPERVVGADLADVVVGEQRRRVELQELGGRRLRGLAGVLAVV